MNSPKPWTVEERKTLMELRAQKIAWEEVALRCGHSIKSCRSTHSKIKTGRRPEPQFAHRAWSAEDVAALHRLFEVESAKWRDIDEILNRAAGASKTKYYSLRRAPPLKPDLQRDAAAEHTAKQEHVARGRLFPKSLTAVVCGDPLPGRSALDKMRAAPP